MITLTPEQAAVVHADPDAVHVFAVPGTTRTYVLVDLAAFPAVKEEFEDQRFWTALLKVSARGMAAALREEPEDPGGARRAGRPDIVT